MSEMRPVSPSGPGSAVGPDIKALARELIRGDARKAGEQIPNTSKAFKKLDEFLNLGRTRDLSLSDLSDEEKEEFGKMLSTLVKHGIVGYTVYDVDGRPEKHYVLDELGNSRLKGRKVWDEKRSKIP